MVNVTEEMVTYIRFLNYEPAQNREDFTLNAVVVAKIGATQPKEGSKAFDEVIKRQAIIDEYIARTGDDTCEISEEFLDWVKTIDANSLVPD